MLQKPDPAYWLMWRRTLDSSGYSPLDQITDSVNGKQYVAVSTGPSLVAGATARLTPVPDSFGVP